MGASLLAKAFGVGFILLVRSPRSNYGRERGVGRPLGVGAILGVGVAPGVDVGVVVGVAVAVPLAVGVGVGVEPDCTQYLPPVFR